MHIQNCLKIRNLRSTSPLKRYLITEESAKSICHLWSLPKMNIYDERYFRDPHEKKKQKQKRRFSFFNSSDAKVNIWLGT